MRPHSIAVLLLSFLLVPAANAVCTLNLRLGDPSMLAWDPVTGVRTYQVQESTDNYKTSRNYFITAPFFKITRRASADTTIRYRVTAILDTNVQSLGIAPLAEGCSEQLAVNVRGDAQFRAMTRKAVVPIAGSGPGANGGRFKTTLKLTTSGPDQRGRIVFHPAGAIASANDPSTPYSFPGGLGQTIVFDDIVAKLGRSGIGTIDIVPDDDAASTVPTIQARNYNDTPAGTFGSTIEGFLPFDYLQAPPLEFQVPDAQFRINIGIRTFSATVAKVLIFGVDGRLRDFTDLSWPADYMNLAAPNLILGRQVAAGERVQIFFDGAALPFYTLTENRTNDPDVIVARPAQSNDVGSYVE